MGWYVQAVDDDPRSETGLATPRKISPAGAILIAQAFDQALSDSLGRSVDFYEAGVRKQNEIARILISEASADAALRAEHLSAQLSEEARRRAEELDAWG